MLKLKLKTDFKKFHSYIVKELQSSGVSGALVDSSVTNQNGTVVAMDMFERYSSFGDNRVSMSVVMVCSDGQNVDLTAMSGGGSRAVFFKVNTISEERFLDKLRDAINAYAGRNVI